MGTIIVIAVIVIIAALALRGSLSHFKGSGGCCGGGETLEEEHKELEGPKIAEKIVYIEGMHCENCKNSVERVINRIDGAAAKVDLRRNLAVVALDREVSDEKLRKAIELIDFKVTRIETKEA